MTPYHTHDPSSAPPLTRYIPPMRVMLIQPPRHFWPFTSEGDNFLVPQHLVNLAAVAREAGHEVKVLDCMPAHVGWRTLHQEIKDFRPHVVGCGENHALYAHEAMRFFRLVRESAPEAYTVAGGGHFTNMSHLYADHPDIDAICVGEGEITFAQMLEQFAKDTPDLSGIPGVVYSEGDRVVRNPPRTLVKDLDDLPIPAYDLVPMHLYGKSRYLFSPGGTTIHHSRGCTSKCSFCAWWTTMADRKVDADGNTKLSPRWRTKSPDKMMEELELLYYRYGKRSFVWVDESWNIDPRFNHQFCTELIRSGMKTKWFAFMRADCILRDEKKGILEEQVRAGLSHILIGVERAEDDSLSSLDKRFYKGGVAEQAIAIFKDKYPQVFIQATFIVGFKEENHASLRKQVQLARKIDVDFPAFHPITPVPGTPVFDKALADGDITYEDFANFDWMSPVLDSEFMTRHEIADALYQMNKEFVNPRWILRGLTSRVDYKRDMYMWFAKVSASVAIDAIKHRLNPLKVEQYQQLVKPHWYDA